ncbi:hypothetical protein D3273_26560 [Lichenibacterium minor]|uniref:Uncharacterized protein n=1 Tax=Lichenibacterium minor TaxID=2316528 RepID=A0A4Q2U289_9HYPH|nr:hypothetical protein [Lichenibacterium minor]RYC28947.1 hypothetical protein D3273_26560 [Lichenibacterium minor]
MDNVAADAPVTLTADEADRVLKIQDTLIASVRAATEAHKAAGARIAQLESDKADLQRQVDELRSHEPNLVDPAVMQPVLDDLAGAVPATHAAIAPHGATHGATQG